MFNTASFPSILEGHNADLSHVSKDLINGLRIYNNGRSYILGNLALSEGLQPHKAINSSPNDLEYKLIMQSALLLANQSYNRPLVLTTGFPYSTHQINKSNAKKFLESIHRIEYDASTFGDQKRAVKVVEVTQAEILPEMMGNVVGLRKGDYQADGSFFAVSLGFGTFEAALSTPNGIVQRTTVSKMGIQYAVDLFTSEMAKDYYLGLKSKKQLDVVFQKDFIVLNRTKIDITKIKAQVLTQYYQDIISPSLRNAFNDSDFALSDKMYITGGGALYGDLIDCFYNEFRDIVDVEVVHNPLTLTSQGYCLHSLDISQGNKVGAIGIDVGNANTVVTQFEDGAFGWK